MLSPSSKPHLGSTPRALGFLRSHAEAEVDDVLIEILKWDKYNPRSTAKNGWSWWRFQNDFFEDEDLYELPASHLLVWVYLCCKRSRTEGSVVRINLRQAADKARTTPEVVEQAIRLFVGLNKLKLHDDVRERAEACVDVRERTQTFPTDETYGRDETDETSPRVVLPDRRRARVKPPAEGTHVWQAYLEAYRRAYGHDPVRNAKSNALCSQLVKRLGLDDAQAVVRFYLTHRGNWYVQKVHQLEYAVKDAEALRTQMLAGHQMTASQAQEVDRNAGTAQAFAATAARLERERLERERMAGGDP